MDLHQAFKSTEIGTTLLQYFTAPSLTVRINVDDDGGKADVTFTPSVIEEKYDAKFDMCQATFQDIPIWIIGDHSIMPYEIAVVTTPPINWLDNDEVTVYAKILLKHNFDAALGYAHSKVDRDRYEAIVNGSVVPMKGTHRFYYHYWILNKDLMNEIFLGFLFGITQEDILYRVSVMSSILSVHHVDDNEGVPIPIRLPFDINDSLIITQNPEFLEEWITQFTENMNKRMLEVQEKAMASDRMFVMYNRNFRISIKAIKKISIGKGEFTVSEKFKPMLFNPTSNQCLFKCLEQVHESLKTTPELRGTICKRANITSLDELPACRIDLVTQMMDFSKNKIALHIYTFGEDGKLRNSPSKYPSNDRSIKDKKIISMVRVKSHEAGRFMTADHVLLMRKADVEEMRKDLRREDITFVRETTPHIRAFRGDIKNMLFKGLKDLATAPAERERFEPKFNLGAKSVYTGVWLYDFETCPKEVARSVNGKAHYDHMPYQASLLRLSDIYSYSQADDHVYCELDGPGFKLNNSVKVKKMVYAPYGLNATDKLVDLLDDIANDIEKEVDRIIAKERMNLDSCSTKKLTDEEKQKHWIAKREQLNKARMQLIIGHNSAKYDMYILLQASPKFIAGMTGKPVTANGYISLEYRNVITFIDFLKFMPASLASVCDTMRIPTLYGKGSMPYEFVREDTLNHKGSIPDEKFWNDKRRPTESLSEFHTRQGIVSYAVLDPELFDLKQHIVEYAKLDVISLGIAVHRYCYSMWKVTLNPHTHRGQFALDCLTLPMLAGVFGMRDINFDMNRLEEYKTLTASFTTPLKDTYKDFQLPDDQCVYVIKNFHVDKFSRACVNGGLVTVNNSRYEAPWFQAYSDAAAIKDNAEMRRLIDLGEKSGEYMDCVDVTSLYPSAMAAEYYPTGKAYIVEEHLLAAYIPLLNDVDKHHMLENLFECEVDFYYKDPKRVIRALLPAKFKDGALVYDCYAKNNYKVCSVDLMEEIKYNGLVVTKVSAVLEWPSKRRLFKDTIWRLFRARQAAKKAKNSVMSELLKLMMNSFYGKMIQRLQLEQKKLITDPKEYDKLHEAGQLGHFQQLLGSSELGTVLLVDQIINEETASEKELDKLINRCPHLGVFILAYSKKLMNFSRDLMGGFDAIVDDYQDTDSFYVQHKYYLLLKHANGVDGPHRLSPYTDENGNPLCWVNEDPNPDNAVLTQFHDDTDDKVQTPMIIRYYAAAAKVKSVEYACIAPFSAPKVWQDIVCPELGFAVKKEEVKQPVTWAPALKFKGSFKGFKAKDDAVNPAYSGWKAQVVAVGDRVINDKGKAVFVKREPTAEEKKIKGLCPQLISNLIPVGSTAAEVAVAFEIQYGQFKKNMQSGMGVASITTSKQLNMTSWQGRHFDSATSHWHTFGSSFISADTNATCLQRLKSKKARGGWTYA